MNYNHNAPGVLVDVAGQTLHVYTEGEGAPTLVFLAGSGAPCPTYDFKPLWARLVPRCRIAVVDRPGYGWSAPTRRARTVDAVLDETRAALVGASVPPPYVLVAHSLSGLDAVHWAQQHPEEVLGIVGLDPAVPAVYDSMRSMGWSGRMMAALLRFTGFYRRKAGAIVAEHPAQRDGLLTDAQRASMVAVTGRQLMNPTVFLEAKSVHENARLVEQEGCPPALPLLCFLSDPKRMGLKGWGALQREFFAACEHAAFIDLDCGHFVYLEETDAVAQAVERFLDNLPCEVEKMAQKE